MVKLLLLNVLTSIYNKLKYNYSKCNFYWNLNVFKCICNYNEVANILTVIYGITLNIWDWKAVWAEWKLSHTQSFILVRWGNTPATYVLNKLHQHSHEECLTCYAQNKPAHNSLEVRFKLAIWFRSLLFLSQSPELQMPCDWSLYSI